MRWLTARTAFCLIVGLVLGGCAEPLDELLVIGRVGGAPALDASSPLPVVSVQVDRVARPALALTVDGAVEIPVDAPGSARALLFHLESPAGAGDTVRYRVSARRGDAWGVLLETELAGPSERWVPMRVALDEDAGAVSSLRFEVVPTGDRPLAAPLHVASIVLLGVPADAVARGQRPNVMLVSLDTLSARYLGYYGNDADPSPNLDSWFESSFAFEKAYAQYGNTFVSHSSLFSGLYPRSHRRYGMSDPNPPLASLVPLFQGAGYRTHAFTENAWVASTMGFDEGFDSYDNGKPTTNELVPGHAEQTFDRARRWLDQHGGEAPFFLFVHTYEVHAPYVPRTKLGHAFANALTPDDSRTWEGMRTQHMIRDHNAGTRVLERADIDRLRALHFGRIAELDVHVQKLFATLREGGLENETLVIVTSDHGDQFGEYGKLGHGASLHDAVMQVPLGFRWPGHIVDGSSAAAVDLTDVMPTVLALAGLPVPEHVEGRSVAPVLLGASDGLEPRPSFSEMRRPKPGCVDEGGSERCLPGEIAVRIGDLKLIRSIHGPRRRLVALDEDPLEAGQNLAWKSPEEVERLSGLVDEYLANGRPFRPTTHRDASESDDDELTERLRALGYIE